MPAKTGSRNGLAYGWALGENNWNVGMDGNLSFIDRFGLHLSFKSFLNTPPGSPAAGDCYVIDAAPTDAWVGKTGQVAVYDDGAWRYGPPRTGWLAYCEADDSLYAFDGAAWSIASGGGGGSDVMAAKTIKGNKNAVSAAAQDLSPSEARTVMGLGTAAVADTGTAPSNVILGNDARLSDAREWTAETVSQADAEAGTATARRAWTAQRVRQAIAAWWNSITNIDGKDIGQTTPGKGAFTDLEIKGPGRRITGDFSNSTITNRVMFQTSTANGTTIVELSPNGTSTSSNLVVSNNSDAVNASLASLLVLASEVRLQSIARGTGAYLPLASYVGGVKNTEQPVAGGLLITTPGGLGYGPGAGGTAVQTTSKSTPVTLNKPCGQITMSNAALAAGASIIFQLQNTLLGVGDLLTLAASAGATSFANYRLEVQAVFPGTAVIRVTNISAVSLSEALTLNFAIIKGSVS